MALARRHKCSEPFIRGGDACFAEILGRLEAQVAAKISLQLVLDNSPNVFLPVSPRWSALLSHVEFSSTREQGQGGLQRFFLAPTQAAKEGPWGSPWSSGGSSALAEVMSWCCQPPGRHCWLLAHEHPK